jgi:hypothetical protein
MIVKAEIHTYFVQTAVLYSFSSVTTNVANVSTLNVKGQQFGMNTDPYISVGNPDFVVVISSGRPIVPSDSPPHIKILQLSIFEK